MKGENISAKKKKTKKMKTPNRKIKVWYCNDCNFEFGIPKNDSSTQFGRCPFCNSDRIKPSESNKRPIL